MGHVGFGPPHNQPLPVNEFSHEPVVLKLHSMAVTSNGWYVV